MTYHCVIVSQEVSEGKVVSYLMVYWGGKIKYLQLPLPRGFWKRLLGSVET